LIGDFARQVGVTVVVGVTRVNEPVQLLVEVELL
jgi:hypothetical protein